MTTLWPIALITFKEGIRNRSIYAISLLAFFLMAANFLLADIVPIDVGKVTVDFTLSILSIAGVLFVLFVGINLMAKDLDKKTIYVILSRPISRPTYIYGKFFGMVMLIMAIMALLSIFGVFSLASIRWMYPRSFEGFRWLILGLAIGEIVLMLILLSALTFLFASFTTSSFITLAFTILAYVIGISMQDVKALVDAPQAVGIQVSPLTSKMVTLAYHVFPNFSLFDIKMQAAHGLSVSPAYLGLTFLYSFVYTSFVIILAAQIFSKKEFP
jgi:Cu-processing system permease protein